MIIFNCLGAEISAQKYPKTSQGTNEFTWKPDNLPGGVYYYKIQVEDNIETGKIIYHK